MKFICQMEYKHIPYETNINNGGNPEDRRTVSSSGCGLCSICMVVDALTSESLSVEECRDLAYECGAHKPCPGTSLTTLGPVVAERFNLTYKPSGDIDEVIACLRAGGKVVARVNKGLFTMRSHYITLISTDGTDFCILDPSYTPTKFHTPEREGRVDDTHAPHLYCAVDAVHAETEGPGTRYHLFERKR